MKTYLARQPIFDRRGQVYGYELLYRSGRHNGYAAEDGDQATKSVVSDALVTIGLENLVGQKFAFINFPRSLLLSSFPFLVTPDSFIIEVLEDIVQDGEVVERLRLLKEKGYLLAIDDYTGEAGKEEILRWVDIVKVDFTLTSPAVRRQLTERYGGRKLLLAEKVETQEEYQEALQWGYDLFQGYFFSKPVVVSHEAVVIASGTYLRIWQEMMRPTPSFERLTEIVRRDVSLSYKLLQRINTMEYYRGHRVTSIRQVLVHMGLGEIKRWVQLILVRDMMNMGSCDELVRMAFIRGTLAEKVAAELGFPQYREVAYTMGLFSILRQDVRQEIAALIERRLLPKEYLAVLCDEHSIVYDILAFVKDYETASWDAVWDFTDSRGLDAETIAQHYIQAVEDAITLFGVGGKAARTAP